MGLLAAHKDNFELLERKYNLIGTLLLNTPYMETTALPDISVKIIEFVGTAIDVVPSSVVPSFVPLLRSLSHLTSLYNKKHQYIMVRIHETLKTLITYKAQYKQVY
jgi:hypothetical protein